MISRFRPVFGWALLAALCAGVLVPVGILTRRDSRTVGTASIAQTRSYRTLVLDAGHGGEDGGAVSLTGVPESRINLAIVKKLDQLLGLYGADTVLLREEDISLHDPSAETLREKKRSDLQNRVAAVETQKDPVLLSIHQNSYPDGRYHGAQVFYANGEEALLLAQRVQEALRSALDPENTRAVKPISEDVYLMNHVSCPAILVECGFLSNPEEEAKLCSGAYQAQLAAVLAGTWLTAGADGGGEEEVLPQYEGKDTVLLYRVRQ